jgi:hypothetical protein
MKRLLGLLTVLLLSTALYSQCNCDKVTFSITKWICAGTNAKGETVYRASVVITNHASCGFLLKSLYAQDEGDITYFSVSGVHVAAGKSQTLDFRFNDNPPVVSTGSKPDIHISFSMEGGGDCTRVVKSMATPNCSKPN